MFPDMADNSEDLSSPERRYSKSFFGEGATNETDKLLTALREAKPSFLTDGQGIRGPDADLHDRERRYGDTFFKRTDADRGSVTRQPRQSAFPPADLIPEVTQVASKSTHPFKVTKGTNSSAGAKAFIRTGTVLGVVPKILLVLLDNNPPPSLLFTINGMVLLRVDISGFSDTFRPAISNLTAVKQDGSVIKDDGGEPLGELKMKWSDPLQKADGYFFIKVADVKCGVPALPAPQVPTISNINQMLLKNVYSFIITVDDILLSFGG